MGTCIVVDDSQDILNVFCELLELIGVDILATGQNGKEAVELYETHNPDLVFVDLVMPEFGGYFAIRNIKENNPHAKIIVVTGDLKADESHLLEVLKVTDIIYKPFDINRIKQVVLDAFLE